MASKKSKVFALCLAPDHLKLSKFCYDRMLRRKNFFFNKTLPK